MDWNEQKRVAAVEAASRIYEGKGKFVAASGIIRLAMDLENYISTGRYPS